MAIFRDDEKGGIHEEHREIDRIKSPAFQSMESINRLSTVWAMVWGGVRESLRSQKGVEWSSNLSRYEHVTFAFMVQETQPKTYFSYHWHPYAVDPAID